MRWNLRVTSRIWRHHQGSPDVFCPSHGALSKVTFNGPWKRQSASGHHRCWCPFRPVTRKSRHTSGSSFNACIILYYIRSKWNALFILCLNKLNYAIYSSLCHLIPYMSKSSPENKEPRWRTTKPSIWDDSQSAKDFRHGSLWQLVSEWVHRSGALHHLALQHFSHNGTLILYLEDHQ